MLEELEPIDENRRYDFNYQQFTYLNKEVQVLPVSISSVACACIVVKQLQWFTVFCNCILQGDTIQLKCFYQSTGNNNVTLVSNIVMANEYIHTNCIIIIAIMRREVKALKRKCAMHF